MMIVPKDRPLPFNHLYLILPAPPESSTLSLHDALPISDEHAHRDVRRVEAPGRVLHHDAERARALQRSEEHTSELQSLKQRVCSFLLDKKKRDRPIR